MSKKYDAIIVIGRFQPYHLAHHAIAQRATALANKLIFIVGSAAQPSTYKNPWSFEQRKRMIKDATYNLALDVVIEPIVDTIYNDQSWASRVQSIVSANTSPSDKIAVIGHKKDKSSFYLDMFPQWELVNIDLMQALDATDIRDLYFKLPGNLNFIKDVVPPTTFQFLDDFKSDDLTQPVFNQIIKEREFISTYKKQFAGLKFSPIFVTSDAVVIQSGHVLMVKRKSEPGKGLLALPGGFVNADTDISVEAAMLRELREETMIKVPTPVLKGNIKESKVFDAINRSARGRTITHAFKIVLPDGELPKVKGNDDAEKAMWVPINDVQSQMCFDDHYQIIMWAVGS